MRNTYTPAGRIQHLYHAGRPLTPDDLPQTWCRDALVLLCPVFQEVTAPLARLARGRLTAASLQGWLREPDPEGRIRLHNDTSFLTALAGIDVLFYSDEDVAHDRSMATRFSQAAPIVLETRGPDGAILWNRQQRTLIPGYRVHETDPTGAGDTFAAAFLLGLDRIRSPELAAEFACKMAAIEVSNPGPLTTDLIARTHGEP
jgi:sugar/nucleoside kinase (ribokinase family)